MLLGRGLYATYILTCSLSRVTVAATYKMSIPYSNCWRPEAFPIHINLNFRILA